MYPFFFSKKATMPSGSADLLNKLRQAGHQGPILLKWIYFNPSMDK